MKIPMKIPGKTVATEINQTNPGNRMEQAISLLLAALGFKARVVDPALACFVVYMQSNPYIHVWCDSC